MSQGKIETLAQMAEVLELEGYEVVETEHSVLVRIGGAEHPFVAVITKNEEANQVQINCKLATLGEIPEDKVAQFFAGCLDANTRIVPYAVGLVSGADNPDLDDEKGWPVVLIDSLPLGDLCKEELLGSFDSLWMALQASREVLASALA